MKTILAAILIFAGSFAFASNPVKLVCENKDSKLSLELTKSIYDVEGTFEYNKNRSGEYGSVMVLGCKIQSYDDNWDLLSCDETSYSVFGPAYQIPKDSFSLSKGKTFSIVELSRDESNGQILSSNTFSNCAVRNLQSINILNSNPPPVVYSGQVCKGANFCYCVGTGDYIYEGQLCN